ncbi:MAG: COX15/CtaA family protein, partial [Opitutaceae bacterium]|nr:COX15/CtaA family protein [Opitutaceae bacterium]
MDAFFQKNRTITYKPFLAWFCILALVWTTFLLYAGGITTSIRAGMAFLDWPLSNGSINPEGWLTEPDKMAEHSHRLLGMIVGLLTITIFCWLLIREERPWLRKIGRIALLLVILQGVLGGARVKLDQLNILTDNNFIAQGFAVAHACTAQIFLCILVAIAIASSRPWIERQAGLSFDPPKAVKRWGLIACGCIFLQLLVGAIMRHSHAGLAIPTFPLTPEGSLIPSLWDFRVGIHFAHRLGALTVVIGLTTFLIQIWKDRQTRCTLGNWAIGILCLISLQVYLGALT